LGAKAALGLEEISFHSYISTDDHSNVVALAQDLTLFTRKKLAVGSEFSVLAACFPAWKIESESAFESRLWDTLNALHHLDSSKWDPKYSGDPKSSDFKYSFAGKAHYIVGLNPQSNRIARRFDQPFLVFNPVWQFENLRAVHRLDRLISIIRRRDRELQGNIHPNLQYEGVLSDAIQYAGNTVTADWSCPFAAGRGRHPEAPGD
jgi:hypothetical protein